MSELKSCNFGSGRVTCLNKKCRERGDLASSYFRGGKRYACWLLENDTLRRLYYLLVYLK